MAGEIRAIDVGGRRYPIRLAADRERTLVWFDGQVFVAGESGGRGSRRRGPAEDAGLRAPMPGKVLRTMARAGDRVARGSTLLILEAMKMEHEIKAPADGTISAMPFSAGDQVEAGATLVEFAP